MAKQVKSFKKNQKKEEKEKKNFVTVGGVGKGAGVLSPANQHG